MPERFAAGRAFNLLIQSAKRVIGVKAFQRAARCAGLRAFEDLKLNADMPKGHVNRTEKSEGEEQAENTAIGLARERHRNRKRGNDEHNFMRVALPIAHGARRIAKPILKRPCPDE